MKAIVLAGGYATRLWPITKNRAKPLLPLAERKIVDFILKDLEKEGRVDQVFISTNKKFAQDFKNHLKEKNYSKAEIFVEDTFAEQEKLGALGAIDLLVKEKEIDEDVLIVGGDNIYSFSISEILNKFNQHKKSMVALYDVEREHLAKKYGIVSVDQENKIIDFEEKPDKPKSTLASMACYLFSEKDLKKLSEYLSNDNNPDEPGNFIQWLHKKSEIYGFIFKEHWFDIGSPESYLEAEKHLQPENHIAGEVKDSEIKGNVKVMPGAEIENSKIENSIVFPEAEIENCKIKNSIIDQDAELKGIDLNDSLIGEHTRLKQE